ncbi:MAG TPA: DUF3618 domain-containing protein, partial [Abditibacterium sp.]
MGKTTNSADDLAGGFNLASLSQTDDETILPDPDDSPTRIRAQIEDTRAGMSETISILQDKISPDRLKEDAGTLTEHVTDQVKEQVQETVSSVSAQVQETVHHLTEQVKGQLE